jgi:HEAT repeat protein
LLKPKTHDARDPVVVAAAWGLARLADPRATTLLRRLLRSPNPEMRALAALGLGRIASARHAPALLGVALSPDSGNLPRAAAITALGVFKRPRDQRHFLALAEAADPLIQRAALLALARSAPRAQPGAEQSAEQGALSKAFAARLADALLDPKPRVQRSALAAATVWHEGSYRASHATWALPEGRVDVQRMLDASLPQEQHAAHQAAALLRLQSALAEAASSAVATSPRRAAVIAQLITAGWRGRLQADVDVALTTQLAALSERLGDATRPAFVALASHPDAAVRKTAIQLLAGSPDPQAQRVIIDALSDDDEHVVSMTLAAMRLPAVDALRHVARLLREANRWPTRAQAARTLGRLSVAATRTDRWPAVAQQALRVAANSDPFALVREAATHGLGLRADANRAALERLAKRDTEPSVRAAARAALEAARRRAPE